MDDPIRALGGVRPTARALGVPVSTVHNWTQRGIPKWRMHQIEEALRTHEDFEDQNRGRSGDAER
jgi:hypothetical protein